MNLILFTNNYPAGLKEQWKENEIILLSSYYKKIDVVPFYNVDKVVYSIPGVSNVNFEDPIIHKWQGGLFRFISGVILEIGVSTFIIELFAMIRSGFCKENVIKLYNAVLRVKQLRESVYFRKLIQENKSDKILYFYWGLGSAEIIPFLKLKNFKNIVVRMHRYDLYLYVNEGYIPFRGLLLKKNIKVLPCSFDGKMHLLSNYRKINADIIVQRLGVLRSDSLIASQSCDNVLRIVSCSNLVPVKRVEMMISVAAVLEMPFHWIHIGSGELESRCRELVKLNQLENFFELIGPLPANEVINFYLNNNVDLFVNLSCSEGVPVSIMEAFSVGIPVVSMDVGGISEIVDNSVGELLPQNATISTVKKAIKSFYDLNLDEKLSRRVQARERFLEFCEMEKLTKELIDILNV